MDFLIKIGFYIIGAFLGLFGVYKIHGKVTLFDLIICLTVCGALGPFVLLVILLHKEIRNIKIF